MEKKNSKYAVGQMVVVLEMKDPYNPVPEGAIGLIEHIDDDGKLFCRYVNNTRNGRTSNLPLIPGVDRFELLEFEEPWTYEFVRCLLFEKENSTQKMGATEK